MLFYPIYIVFALSIVFFLAMVIAIVRDMITSKETKE